MAVKDITLTEDFDLTISGGDISVSESDQQHIELLLRTYVGHWKQFPLAGVGIEYYMASAGQQQNLKGSIITQLVADGYSVTDLLFDIGVDRFEVFVDANRITTPSTQ